MALTSLTDIKNWFKTNLIPTQQQFYDMFDSFRHKNDKVAASDVDGLTTLLAEKASNEGFNAHTTAENAHAGLFGALRTWVESQIVGVGVSSTNLGALTPLTVIPATINVHGFAVEVGTYANCGGVVVAANNLAFISRVGGVWSSSKTAFDFSTYQKIVDGNKMNFWAAEAYPIGTQRNHLGKDWYLPTSAALSTDVPGTSSKWVDRLAAYKDKIAVKKAITINNMPYVKPVTRKNVYDKSTNTLDHYLDTTTGTLIYNVGYQTSDFIKLDESTLHQITRLSFICYFDEDLLLISGANGVATSFTTPANTVFIKFSDLNTHMTSGQQLEVGAVKTAFEEYSLTFDKKHSPIDLFVTKTVKRNGTVGVDCDYTGRRAIQDAIDSITDASISKQYIIKASGVFEATQSSHFDKGTTQKSFILLKPYIHLIGASKDECIITGFLPNNLGVGFSYSSYQTIMHNFNNSRLESISIIGENLRYPLHIDG